MSMNIRTGTAAVHPSSSNSSESREHLFGGMQITNFTASRADKSMSFTLDRHPDEGPPLDTKIQIRLDGGINSPNQGSFYLQEGGPERAMTKAEMAGLRTAVSIRMMESKRPSAHLKTLMDRLSDKLGLSEPRPAFGPDLFQ